MLSDNFNKDVDYNDVSTLLRDIRIRNVNNVIFAHLNTNSFVGKYDSLKLVVPGNVDILIISESKLDESHPTNQLLIEGFAEPFRNDRNIYGGGILIYVRSDIPCKLLTKHEFPEDIEGLFIEINLRKCKWLLLGTYHPPSQNDKVYFQAIGHALDSYSETYDRFILAGDLNAEESETTMSEFMGLYDLKCLIKEKTCFKSLQNPSCVDHFLTNSPKSFQNTTVLSTGMSDFHKMIVTVLKTTFPKSKPKEIAYRDYKKFDRDVFRKELKEQLNSDNNFGNYAYFEKTYLDVLDKHAPMKKKRIRANQVPYMTKALRKAIMTRSMLENRFHKYKTDDSQRAFKRQRNYCNRLYKKERKKYYYSLDPKFVTDNRQFWRNMKPFFSDKSTGKEKITLVEGDQIITDDKEVAQTMNDFFENAVKDLNISEPLDELNFVDTYTDMVDFAIQKYSKHPSIIKINEKDINTTFSFSHVEVDDVEDEIKRLNPKKANTFANIPTKLIKEDIDICAPILTDVINDGIATNVFNDQLKLADLTPVFKKDIKISKKNYRPVSVLPAPSKVFERILQNQMIPYTDTFLSPHLSGFRKGYNTQHSLAILVEKIKRSLDKRGYGGAILLDLSKAFDTINHGLLIAKLHAYGFDKDSLLLLTSYLSNRWQRTKVNTSFSTWSELLQGVPQGSVLGPLLFNIYINDMIYVIEETDICNFADDTTLYACDHNLAKLIKRLENDTNKILDWFCKNYMKLNEDKCHILVFGNKYETIIANIGNAKVIESCREKLLGVYIDSNLDFKFHIDTIYKKAGRKLNALRRQCKILPFQRRRILMKAFFESQFSYCPLVWMFHDRDINNKINNLHYRALRIIYRDEVSTFDQLLKKDKSFTIHQKNIQTLAIEMYKTKNCMSPSFMQEIFTTRNDLQDIRSQTDFCTASNVRTEHFGKDTLNHFGLQIWDLIPNDIKKLDNLENFKTQIKQWVPEKCPCKLCKTYVPNLGYVNLV